MTQRQGVMQGDHRRTVSSRAVHVFIAWLYPSMSPVSFPWAWHGSATQNCPGGFLSCHSALCPPEPNGLSHCMLWAQAGWLLIQTPVELGAKAPMSRASHCSLPGA